MKHSLHKSTILQRITMPLLSAAMLLTSLTANPQPVAAATMVQQTVQAEQPNQAHVDIEKSDNKSLIMTVRFPAPQTQQVRPEDGNNYTQLFIPGIDPQIGEAGKPDIPTFRRLLGVPSGAKVKVVKVTPTVRRTANVLLYPVQISPRDQEDPDPNPAYGNQPFVRDDETYASDQNFPERPVQVRDLGHMRDLQVAQISVASGVYQPAERSFSLFEAVQIEIAFEGGEEHFLERGLGNDFELPGRYDIVINRDTLQEHVFVDPTVHLCFGAEYLIITDPSFRSAADSLAVWKRTKGITTGVFETGSDPNDAGTTALEIQDFIRNKYNNCIVRPSYVLLFGDAEFIPPFYRNLSDGVSAGTDLDYSLMDNLDIMPDLALGRIPVDTLADAQIVVDKTINYEQNPPRFASFYNDVSMASYFQCCRNDVANDGTDMRSFVETSELVRDFLLTKSYDVERIYTTDTGYSSNSANSSYYPPGRDTTPRRYYNGTLLPGDLGAGSGFAWNGNSTDVINAFNEGRFLVIHRDHGSKNGWGDPSFSVTQLSQLTNTTESAIVYSINCSSGLFDNETNGGSNGTTTTGVYFLEKLIREPGGAVGAIGDTRASGTWVNSALLRGLIDASWHLFLPADGGSTNIARLGDILNYGKEYMVGQVGVPQTAGSVSQDEADDNVILYHVYGDPTLEMWKKSPYPFSIVRPVAYDLLANDLIHVQYAVDGAAITIQQNGNPIGRGIIQNGEATIQMVSTPVKGKAISFSASLPGEIGRRLRPAHATGKVDPSQGGTLSHSRTRFAIQFPAGAVNNEVQLYYESEEEPTQPLTGDATLLRSFKLDAQDDSENEINHFNADYVMELSYDDSEIVGMDESKLRCVYLDETNGQWQAVRSSVDTTLNKVTCEADHFTEFALVGDSAEGQSNESAIYLPLVVR